MSQFEKTIIPLVSDCIKSIDLTPAAGFIDSFTTDSDRPNTDAELFLVYNDDIRNDFVSDRMMRFESSMDIKRTYVKYVNNVPYYIYSFWIKPEVKKLYNGIITLNTAQKVQICSFWGPLDSVVNNVFSNQVLKFDTEHSIPLADYNESPFERLGLVVTKKGLHRNVLPFYFYILLNDPKDRRTFYLKDGPPNEGPEDVGPENEGPEDFFFFSCLKS